MCWPKYACCEWCASVGVLSPAEVTAVDSHKIHTCKDFLAGFDGLGGFAAFAGG